MWGDGALAELPHPATPPQPSVQEAVKGYGTKCRDFLSVIISGKYRLPKKRQDSNSCHKHHRLLGMSTNRSSRLWCRQVPAGNTGIIQATGATPHNAATGCPHLCQAISPGLEGNQHYSTGAPLSSCNNHHDHKHSSRQRNHHGRPDNGTSPHFRRSKGGKYCN